MVWLIVFRWLIDFGWLLFLLGLFRHFWQARQVSVRAQSWLIVQGYITACKWATTGHSIWPTIEYSYQVNERELIGEYLLLDTAHNNPNSKHSRSMAYKVAVAFQDNTGINVYYNPNNPEQSALDVTVPIKLNVILILIGVAVIIHVGFIFWRYLS